MRTVGDVRHEREMLEFKVDAVLRQKGWKCTSTTPGCLWLWEKLVVWTTLQIIPGTKQFKTLHHERTVMTDKETAIAIQDALDHAEALQQANGLSEPAPGQAKR